MTGSVELDRDGSSLLIRFAYREDLVALVKDFPGRRWDPKQKLWRVPASHVERVFAALSRHLFEFAPEIPSLLAGTLGTPASTPDAAPAASARDAREEAPAIGVAELNARVRDGLRHQFPDLFWVVGEIVDFD